MANLAAKRDIKSFFEPRKLFALTVAILKIRLLGDRGPINQKPPSHRNVKQFRLYTVFLAPEKHLAVAGDDTGLVNRFARSLAVNIHL